MTIDDDDEEDNGPVCIYEGGVMLGNLLVCILEKQWRWRYLVLWNTTWSHIFRGPQDEKGETQKQIPGLMVHYISVHIYIEEYIYHGDLGISKVVYNGLRGWHLSWATPIYGYLKIWAS